MKDRLVLLWATVACVAWASPARGDAISGQGTAQYTRWSHSSRPGSLDREDREGLIEIRGKAARLLFLHMVNAREQTAARELATRPPSKTTLSDLDGRVGTNAACFQRPLADPKKDAWQRDSSGRLIYEIYCAIHVEDVTTGTFTRN